MPKVACYAGSHSSSKRMLLPRNLPRGWESKHLKSARHGLVPQISKMSILVILAASILGCTQFVQAQSVVSKPPDIQEMQQKIELLQKNMWELREQINALKQMQAASPGHSPAATAESATPSAVEAKKVNAEEPSGFATKLDLYGFVKLDSGYDFKTINPDWPDVMRPSKLPSRPGEFAPDGKVYFGIRPSRFGVKTNTATKFGPLKTQFEFDLYGVGVDAGQTAFHLRQAWGELGFLLAGQTWSPFMDIDVFPNQLEYWGPNGMVFFRNIQVRVTPLRTDKNEIAIAVERPSASGDEGVYADRVELQGVKPKFGMPDFSWHYRGTRSWGYVQVGGILRKLSWVDNGNNPNMNLSDSAFGWGLSLSSNLKFSHRNTGKFQVVYGEGIQSYMRDAPADVGLQYNPSDPTKPVKGVALPVLGVVAFLDHNWSEHFDSSIGYSMMNVENSDGQAADAYHQGHYVLGNLLYHPVKNVTIGGEFQFGRRLNFKDGFNVNDYRTQFSFKYDWGKTFAF
jgi:hypothetical protein